MRQQPRPPKKYRRVLVTAPKGAPMSLWATVEHADDGKRYVHLVFVENLSPAAGWSVEIEGESFFVAQVRSDGVLICEASHASDGH